MKADHKVTLPIDDYNDLIRCQDVVNAMRSDMHRELLEIIKQIKLGQGYNALIGAQDFLERLSNEE